MEENNGKKLKVLQLSHAFVSESMGGVEVYLSELCGALLDNHNQEVEVTVAYPAGDQMKRFTYQNIPIITFPINHIKSVLDLVDVKMEDSLNKILDEVSPDVVHLHGTFSYTPNAIKLIQSRVKTVVVTLHDWYPLCPRIHMHKDGNDPCRVPNFTGKCSNCLIGSTNADLGAALKGRTEKFVEALSLCSMVICPSEYIADSYRKSGLSNNLIVHPLGIKSIDKTTLEKQDSPLVVFGYIGQVRELKQTLVMAKAFETVRGGNARLVIYGDAYPTELSEIYKVMARDPRISYNGKYNREDLPSILSKVSVGIVPSLVESYSLTVRELLSAGIPVIASSGGALPEIVESGKNGLLFNPRKPEQLRDAISRLLYDKELVKHLSSNIQPVYSIEEDAGWLLSNPYKGT